MTSIDIYKGAYWKLPACASAGEWIRALWYIHAVESYTVVKKNPVLRHTAAQIHRYMWWAGDRCPSSKEGDVEQGPHLAQEPTERLLSREAPVCLYIDPVPRNVPSHSTPISPGSPR